MHIYSIYVCQISTNKIKSKLSTKYHIGQTGFGIVEIAKLNSQLP